MRMREFQLDRLNEARRLQQDCVRLHLPSPPVLSWEYEIQSVDGEVIEKGIGKSNSFVRNALNAMAYYVGMVNYSKCSSSAFGDGVISYKNVSGNIRTFNEISVTNNYRSTSRDARLYLGTSTAPESIDYYQAPSGFGLASGNLILSYFDAVSRKLITVIERTYTNTTGAPVEITESGLTVFGESAAAEIEVLTVRDVFDAITLAPGEVISWKYVLEIAYPA